MKNAAVWAIVTVGALTPVSAAGSDWIRIGKDTSGNSWFVDRESLVREPDVVRAWKRIEFAKPQPYPPNGKLISVALFLKHNELRQETGWREGEQALGGRRFCYRSA
jgi:hypothetical protein